MKNTRRQRKQKGGGFFQTMLDSPRLKGFNFKSFKKLNKSNNTGKRSSWRFFNSGTRALEPLAAPEVPLAAPEVPNPLVKKEEGGIAEEAGEATEYINSVETSVPPANEVNGPNQSDETSGDTSGDTSVPPAGPKANEVRGPSRTSGGRRRVTRGRRRVKRRSKRRRNRNNCTPR